MDLFRPCSNCHMYPSIYNIDRLPFINPNSSIYCRACAYRDCLEAPEEYYNAFKNEELKAICNCEPRNEVKSGACIDIVNLKVYCDKCAIPGLHNLHTIPARIALKKIITNLLNDKNIPKEYIKRLNRLSKESAEDIFKILFSAKLYTIDQTYCSTHFKQTCFYDLTQLKYVCEMCNSAEKIIDIRIQSDRNKVDSDGLELCKTSKTFAFTSTIIKSLKFKKNYGNLPANFLLDLKDLKSSSKAALTEDAFCLECEETFSFNLPPVSIHGEELHEICLRCYNEKKKKINCCFCPVCPQPFLQEAKILLYPALYEIKINCCSNIHPGVKKFSIKKESLPYLTPCFHNICSECKNKANGSDNCRDCDITFNFSDCILNQFLVQKLKFTEIICKKDIQPVTKFLIIENDFELLCPSCKVTDKFKNKSMKIPDKVSDFANLLNKLLIDKYSNFQGMHFSFLSRLDFIPLQNRLKLLNPKNNTTTKYIFRYNKFEGLIPSSGVSFAYWYDLGNKNTFYIKSDVNFIVKGFFFGKGIDTPPNIKFFLDRKELQFQCYEQNFIWYFFFLQEIEITEKTFFDFQLGKGRYFQMKNQGHKPLKIMLSKKYEILLEFTTMKSGNMGIGGPLLGIISEKYVWL